MRALAIFGALLLGLIGLFMSVCGGGFVLMTLLTGGVAAFANIAVIAVPSLIAGVVLTGASIAIVRRRANRDDTDTRS